MRPHRTDRAAHGRRTLTGAATVVAALMALLALTALAPAADSAVVVSGGVAPTYPHRSLETPLNGQAIDRAFWAPGLNSGFVPQGITRVDAGGPFTETRLLVSGYSSRGCSVYAVSPFTGSASNPRTVPGCSHAGGIVNEGDRRVWVADTHVLIELSIDRLFGSQAGDPVLRRIPLPDTAAGSPITIHGSFVVYNGTSAGSCPCIGIGDNDTQRIRWYSRAYLRSVPSGRWLDRTQELGQTATPVGPQGAAYDSAGRLWVTSSDWASSAERGWGRVQRLTGSPTATYNNFVPGIEGVTATPDGDLWAVSEAGSLPYAGGRFFPLVFRFRPGLLNHP